MKQVQLKQMYCRILYVKCVGFFYINLVSPKYHPSCLNELTFKGNIFSVIKLLTIVFVVVMLLLIAINSKNTNQRIQIHLSE